ncbi:MAG TPA: hypothetical protein VFZ27_15630 [Terriglobia bacterium]|nr:hypothetical protein [Terriglobia bacterium]
MRAISIGLLIAASLSGVGYVLQGMVPDSSVFTVDWQSQQYLIPYNIAVFWGCVAIGVIAGFIQALRVMLRDLDRLR